MKHTLEDCLDLIEKSNLSNADTVEIINDPKHKMHMEILQHMWDVYTKYDNNPSMKGYVEYARGWIKKGLFLCVEKGTLYIEQTDDIEEKEILDFIVFEVK